MDSADLCPCRPGIRKPPTLGLTAGLGMEQSNKAHAQVMPSPWQKAEQPGQANEAQGL